MLATQFQRNSALLRTIQVRAALDNGSLVPLTGKCWFHHGHSRVDSSVMSNEITLSELQEFIGRFWYHYDEANYQEMAEGFAEDIHFITRSDSGASPFEELMSPELSGRDNVVEWMIEHRQQSPYPLRHFINNVFRTGTSGDVTSASLYLFVTQTANYVPFGVSSGIAKVCVRRGSQGLEFTDVNVVLDITDSAVLAELATTESATADA